MPGAAAGCELLNIAPYTIEQHLTPVQKEQAAKMYVFDLMCQNSDRRKQKVNCGLIGEGLLAFDFEKCFNHLFVPIIGGLKGVSWEPSKAIGPKSHLFYKASRQRPLPPGTVINMIERLNQDWWQTLCSS